MVSFSSDVYAASRAAAALGLAQPNGSSCESADCGARASSSADVAGDVTSSDRFGLAPSSSVGPNENGAISWTVIPGVKSVGVVDWGGSVDCALRSMQL